MAYHDRNASPSGETPLRYQIEIDREEDGRWIAEIASLPGVMAYGKTKQEAVAKVKALALMCRLPAATLAARLQGYRPNRLLKNGRF